MIVLDTNIISEVMSRTPSSAVLDWLNEQDASDLFLTTITVAEICYGLCVLPDGARRQMLETRFEQFIATGFEYRILDFDVAAARAYGAVMGRRRKIGRPISLPDGQIAAITQANGFALATRNTRDFEELGLQLYNPFEDAGD